jgi:hypothetical protein
MSKTDKQNRKERGEDGRVRTYFERIFAKYDVRSEQQIAFLGKWLVFILLMVVQALILLKNFSAFTTLKGWLKLLPLQIAMVVFTFSEAFKLFAIAKKWLAISFYVLNAVSACAFLFLASGAYALIIYVLVLTEFYITAKNGKTSAWVYLLCVPVYALIYTARISFDFANVGLFQLLRESIGAFVVLSAHFLLVQMALSFYRQFLRLDKALKDLSESKKELEKAIERGIIRQRHFDLDERFLNNPDLACQYRMMMSERDYKRYFITILNYFGQDINDILISDEFGSRRINAIRINGSKNGISVEMSMYDSFPPVE